MKKAKAEELNFDDLPGPNQGSKELNFDDLPGPNQGSNNRASGLHFDHLAGGPSPFDLSRLIAQFGKGATPAASASMLGFGLAGPVGAAVLGTSIPIADSLGDLYNRAARAAGHPDAQIRPTSQTIRNLMEKTPFYDKARNQPERIAEVAGEAAGLSVPQIKAAVALSKLGGSQFLAKAPKTQMVSATTSAAVGQKVSEDTDSPMKSLAASILTGVIVGRGGARKIKAVDVDGVRKQAAHLYKRAEDAGVVLNPQFVYRLHTKMLETIRQEGFDPDLHSGLKVVMNRLESTKGAMPLQALERTRRVLKNARKSGDYDEGRIAADAMDDLDEAIASIGKRDLISGKLVGTKSLLAARDVWARKSKAEVIEEMIGIAQVRGAAKYSQSGFENAMRNQFSVLWGNKKRLRQFNKSEQAMIKKIAMGDLGVNALRWIGKLAPKGVVSAALSIGGGTAIGGPIGGVAVPVAGFAGQNAAARINLDRIRRMQQGMATGQTPPGRWANVPVSAMRAGMSNPEYGLLDF